LNLFTEKTQQAQQTHFKIIQILKSTNFKILGSRKGGKGEGGGGGERGEGVAD